MDLKDFMISETQKAQPEKLDKFPTGYKQTQFTFTKIGRASCRERV